MHLLALEFFHSASMKEDLNDRARVWLLKIENVLAKQVDTFSPVHSGVYNFYMDAIILHGTKFFNGVYPLALTEVMCMYGTKKDMSWPPKIRMLCFNMLMTTASSIDKYASALKNSNSSFVSYTGKMSCVLVCQEYKFSLLH
jgi:hypothetical protein